MTAQPKHAGQSVPPGTFQRDAKVIFPGGSNTTNSSAIAAASAKSPTITEPVSDLSAGRGIIAVSDDNWLMLEFFGTDAANETGGFAVWGWRRVRPSAAGQSPLWVPHLLAQGTFTLGSLAGVAASPVDADQLFADGITVSTDNSLSPPSATALGTGANGAARLALDFEGFALAEVELTTQGGSAASVNGLWWTL